MEKNDNIAALVESIEGLVTLPHLYVRISQLIEDPDSNMADLAQAINQDPAFAVRLLRVANSSFYGFSSSIATVEKAVSVIGTSQIRSLALSMYVAKSFAGLPNDLVSMENFWQHSLYCGLAARILARHAGKCDKEAVFTAGLLHDVGELILYSREGERSRQALTSVLDSADELQIHEAERQVFGFDHGQLGLELAKHWKLPEILVECIGCHHDIADAHTYPREVAIVHIANILAQMAELDTRDFDDAPTIDPAAWAVCGLEPDPDFIAEVLDELKSQYGESAKMFFEGEQ